MQMDKITNKKNNLLNRMMKKNGNNKKVDNDDIDTFFDYIMEDCGMKYSDLIKNNYSNNKLDVKFGKFFKNNGGIKKNINNIYEFCEIKDLEHNNKYKSFLIFDFLICDKLYYSFIFIDVDNGSCDTCNMGFSYDCKMYIDDNLKDLVFFSIGNEIDYFL